VRGVNLFEAKLLRQFQRWKSRLAQQLDHELVGLGERTKPGLLARKGSIRTRRELEAPHAVPQEVEAGVYQ